MRSTRDLNRTLLARQHLLERTAAPALGMVDHLIGLQAQDNLSPYLSLAARIEGFDPAALSSALEVGDAVRLVALRGTIHVLTPDDALSLRRWVQPALDRVAGSSPVSAPARHVPVDALVEAVHATLADGPVSVKGLGERLAETFDAPAAALAHAARERVALVQLPPRGLWGRSGGVRYQTVERQVGRPSTTLDLPGLVRRYLRAFGPATASDMTTWSRVTRLGPVFAAMREELVEVACEDGRTRYDVPDALSVEGDAPAPVRLLGGYDNVWLSHADRSRVMPEDVRRRWQGPNGGTGHTLWVDGFMAGLWWWRDHQVETEVFSRLSPRERVQLDDEVERVTTLLRG